jgi:hypothetical protein
MVRRILYEDNINHEMSYPDFLCEIHKLINAKTHN